MPAFEYTVINHSGNRTAGRINADTLDDAIWKLQQDFATVITVKAARRAAKENQDRFSDRITTYFKTLANRVPQKNIVFFTRQLATMFSAGMTIEKSLQSLGRHEKHKKFKSVISQISSGVQSGKSLSDSIAQHPGAFNSLYIALIKAGEMSGTLGEILDRLADYLERTEEVRRKVVSALYYPICVLSILALSVYLLVVVVAPRFSSVYESFGAKLPLPTQILMKVSTFLVNNFWAGFLIIPALLGMMIAFSLTDRGRLIIDTIKLHIPVIGSLIRDSIMSRFSRTLGLLMSTSVPVLDAFGLAAHVVHNIIIQRAVTTAQNYIQDGSNINRALNRTNVFPDIFLQLVATGEETGEIDGLLLKSADYYEKQVNSMVGRLTSLIEPLLIVLLGLVVGALVIIIYLPIFYIGSAMRQGLG